MNTVWHYWNIFKTFVVVVIVGGIITLFNLPTGVDVFAGMISGMGASLFCMSIWDLWHFE